MPTVELRFAALPSHVRTARLVAATVARRAGLREETLDEVRLAVGEACLRAVELHRAHCPERLIQVTLHDSPDRFAVSVTDSGGADEIPGDADLQALRAGLVDQVVDTDPAAALPAGLGLAMIGGLVEDVTITSGEHGLTVSMSWPLD